MITNKNYNVDHASSSDRKLLYGFAKEIFFHVKAQGYKCTRDRTLIKLLTSPGLMISASGFSNTIFLSSDPNELCDRLKLFLQEKQAGNNFKKINGEFVPIVDKLLEYKSFLGKQHKQLLTQYNLLHTKKKQV